MPVAAIKKVLLVESNLDYVKAWITILHEKVSDEIEVTSAQSIVDAVFILSNDLSFDIVVMARDVPSGGPPTRSAVPWSPERLITFLENEGGYHGKIIVVISDEADDDWAMQMILIGANWSVSKIGLVSLILDVLHS